MRSRFQFLNSLLVLALLQGCSSIKTQEREKSPTSEDSMSDSAGSDKGGSSGSLSSAAEAAPTKNELYDGVKLALSSSDDTTVEKAVASILSQDQNDSKALNALALYHLSKGRTPLAKMIFKSILDKEPKNPVVLNNMGCLYSQLGERRLATEHFRKALEVKSDYPVASANLGSILAIGRDYARAKRYLENAYEGGIKDLCILNNYAIALMAEGDSDAQGIFKEALQVGSSDFTVAFNYSLYLTYIKKDYKEAAEALDKIRFLGMPPKKKNIVLKMEETISGQRAEENKSL